MMHSYRPLVFNIKHFKYPNCIMRFRKDMANGLTIEAVQQLDKKLKFYCWPEITNYQESDLIKLEKIENFNKDNYDEAVAIYIYWRNTVLPTIEEPEKEGFHLCLGQQIYNILHMYAPAHHIHLALRA